MSKDDVLLGYRLRLFAQAACTNNVSAMDLPRFGGQGLIRRPGSLVSCQ